MSKPIVWMVSEYIWQYEDLKYVKCKGTNPVACFTMKEIAEEYVLEMNIKKARSIHALCEYMWRVYRPNVNVLIEGGMHSIEANIISYDIMHRIEILSKYSDENIALILKACGINFYEIRGIELYA